jgi:hypothetical protein
VTTVEVEVEEVGLAVQEEVKEGQVLQREEAEEAHISILPWYLIFKIYPFHQETGTDGCEFPDVDD